MGKEMINEKLKIYYSLSCKMYAFYLLNTFISHLVFLRYLVPGNMRNNVGTEQMNPF